MPTNPQASLTPGQIAAANPVPPEARVGYFTAVKVTPNRLVLRGSPMIAALVVLIGLAAGGWGAYEWWQVATFRAVDFRWQLGLPLVGIGFIAVGIWHGAKVLTFDGASHSVLKGWGKGRPVASNGAGYKVMVKVYTHQGHETVALGVEVVGGAYVLIETMRSDAEDAIYMLAAAATMAHLLNAPLEVAGECREAGKAFRQFFAMLEVSAAAAAAPATASAPHAAAA